MEIGVNKFACLSFLCDIEGLISQTCIQRCSDLGKCRIVIHLIYPAPAQTNKTCNHSQKYFSLYSS